MCRPGGAFFKYFSFGRGAAWVGVSEPWAGRSKHQAHQPPPPHALSVQGTAPCGPCIWGAVGPSHLPGRGPAPRSPHYHFSMMWLM